MRVAVLGLLLMGCGPVLLGEDPAPPAHDAGSRSSAEEDRDAATSNPSAPDASDLPSAPASGGGTARPSVSISVQPLECGRCFDLHAAGAGGQPPYRYEWEDGSTKADRHVCVAKDELWVSVVATDSDASRTDPHLIRLESIPAGECPPTTSQPTAAKSAMLCLENPSFEGTPAPNFGQSDAFDAAPWSACSDQATTPVTPNTPNIVNDTITAPGVTPPKPKDGSTYLAMLEGEQVSQLLCSSINAGDTVHFEIDLARIDVGEGFVPQTEGVFLEVYAGVAVDCSQHDLLWASPALQPEWKRFCVTIHPNAFLNQITLRANADMTEDSPGYLAVDNIRPVSSCP